MFLLQPLFAADVVITEIMYDPAGTDSNREWIEIHNPSAQAVDLSAWKIFENGANHSLTGVQGGTLLPAGGYAVIASSASLFIAEYSTAGSSGWIVLDSAFSLSNTGESFAVRDGSGVVHSSLTYSNAAPWPVLTSGQTLSRVSATGGDNDPANWTAGPVSGTPGVSNVESVVSSTLTLDALPAYAVGELPVSGSAPAGSGLTIISRTVGQMHTREATAGADGRYSGATGVYGNDGQPFEISVTTGGAETPRQMVILDNDGERVRLPVLDSLPAYAPQGQLEVDGNSEAGSDVIVVVTTEGNDFEQPFARTGFVSPWIDRFDSSAGLFGSDGQLFHISAYSRLGAEVTARSASQTVVLDTDNIRVSIPVLDSLPEVVHSTASGRFVTIVGSGEEGSEIVVVVRTGGETYEQPAVRVGLDGRFSASAGIFGADGQQFNISAYARLGSLATGENTPQTVTLNIGDTPAAPVLSALGTSATGAYDVQWSSVSAVIYELHESTSSGFATFSSFWPSAPQESFTRSNGTYYYRVRAWSDLPENGGFASEWSAVEDVTVNIVFPVGGVVINEILYDPAGTDSNREWVEIHNKTSQSVDLTGWKINDGSNHNLTFVQGGSVLAAGGYAIVAASATTFITEYASAGSANWMVIDSVLSLTNTSDVVAIIDAAGVAHSSLTYSNAAPWPVLASGQTLERISPAGADTAASNWQAGPSSGTPGAATLPALTVPTVNPVPAVFAAVGAEGGFMRITGAATPLSDVIVVVRVNGNTFEQSPVYVPESGVWEAQVGIFGSDGDAFSLSAYGKRGASATAESARQTVKLETDGVPNLDAVASVFSSTSTGGFLRVTGTAAPETDVIVVVRVNGNTFEQSPVFVPASGVWEAEVGIFGEDCDVFQLSAFGRAGGVDSAESAAQPTVLDRDGTALCAPRVNAIPSVFSSTGAGGFMTVTGKGMPLSDAILVVRVGGNAFEQSPVFVPASGEWTAEVGIFGNDCDSFGLSAYTKQGSSATVESAVQYTVLNTDGQAACVPTLDPIPAFFVATGTVNGDFLDVAGLGTPGSEVVVVVRVNGNTFEQTPAVADASGRYAAEAGLFGAHRSTFTLSAYSRLGSSVSAESGQQSTVLILQLPGTPVISPLGASQTGSYTVAWNGVSAAIYELQESTASDFASISASFWPTNPSESISRGNGSYYYRVRAWDNLPEKGGISGAWSAAASVAVNIVFPAGGVVINEIQYDPDGTDSNREWLEVHNKSGLAVDIAKWKLFENGSNHSLTAVQGGSLLPAGGYAVIASSATAFLADYAANPSSSTWIVFDSAFSLSNSGETLAVVDSSGVVHSSVTYSNASPWPVLGAAGRTLERKSPNGPDNDPANWAEGRTGGSPGAVNAPIGTGTPLIVAMGTSTTGNYVIIWSSASKATLYELQEALCCTFSEISASFWPSGTQETISGRADGTYYYRVRGWTAAPENGGISGEWSPVEDVAVVLPPRPAAPVIASMGASGTGNYVVSWSSHSLAGIYELQESTSTDFASLVAFWPSSSQESISGRTNGTYYYRVRGWTAAPENNGVPGPWSALEDITVNLTPVMGVTVSKVIGPEGGYVPSNGYVEVIIPPGALDRDVTITITPQDPAGQPDAKGAPSIAKRAGYNGLALAAADFGPDGLTFKRPVQIRLRSLDTDRDGFPEQNPGGETFEVPNAAEFRTDDLKVYRYEAGRWILMGGKQVDEFVAVPVNHFSKYAVFPAAANGALTPQERFLTPNGDGVNDVATFGLNAARVRIFDTTGLEIWSRDGDTFTAIQWDATDEAGNAVGSGPYLYQARDANGALTSGVIVVAR